MLRLYGNTVEAMQGNVEAEAFHAKDIRSYGGGCAVIRWQMWRLSCHTPRSYGNTVATMPRHCNEANMYIKT